VFCIFVKNAHPSHFFLVFDSWIVVNLNTDVQLWVVIDNSRDSESN
jgi:hypothetical protein